MYGDYSKDARQGNWNHQTTCAKLDVAFSNMCVNKQGSSVTWYVQKIRMKPYQMSCLQELKAADCLCRLHYANWLLNFVQEHGVRLLITSSSLMKHCFTYWDTLMLSITVCGVQQSHMFIDSHCCIHWCLASGTLSVRTKLSAQGFFFQ